MQVANWIFEDGQLKREFEFEDFLTAFKFMTKVAELAELQNHHPDWQNVYNRVSIKLCTHSAGNIVTEKDVLLAEAINQIHFEFTQ